MVGAAAAQTCSPRCFAAHRGGALLWPENSLLAFRNALALGADFLEFDVHLSRDGEVMVIHDATLERTTTGAGPVRDRTVAELGALRLKDRTGAVTAETVPTLDEVVALAAAGPSGRMLLEIKVDAAAPALSRRSRRRCWPCSIATGSCRFTVVMAFEAPTWRRVRELRPDARRGRALLGARCCARAERSTAELETLRAAGVRFVGLDQTLVDARGGAAGAGWPASRLGVWTVNERGRHRAHASSRAWASSSPIARTWPRRCSGR